MAIKYKTSQHKEQDQLNKFMDNGDNNTEQEED